MEKRKGQVFRQTSRTDIGLFPRRNHTPYPSSDCAGYGNEENLLRLDEKEVKHLIKYTMFDQEQKRRYKQSARNLANWYYDDKEDSYTYPDGWCYRFHPIKHQKTQTDFEQEIKIY